jgi:hypothetical protein
MAAAQAASVTASSNRRGNDYPRLGSLEKVTEAEIKHIKGYEGTKGLL